MKGVRHRHLKGEVKLNGHRVQTDVGEAIDHQKPQSNGISRPKATAIRRSSSLERSRTKSTERSHSAPHEHHSQIAGIISSSRHFVEEAEDLVLKVVAAGWQLAYHHTLPKWLQDNEYIVSGHRRPQYSFRSCFQSVFQIHSETGNIWTHLLAMIAFIFIAVYTLGSRYIDFQWQDITVHTIFFAGAITCFTLSWVYHTVFCHSKSVLILFGKLDYCGIAILTMGSFVPWLYYCFYCRPVAHAIYLVCIVFLCTSCIVVTLKDEFSTPAYRFVKVGLFISLGLTGVFPGLHFLYVEGYTTAMEYGFGHLLLMAALYISGALLYGFRIPESIYPGKFDLWCHSHQIFHMFVIFAALVHFRGIQIISTARLNNQQCETV